MISTIIDVYFWISFSIFTIMFFRFMDEVNPDTGVVYSMGLRVFMSLVAGFVGWPIAIYRIFFSK